MREMRIISISIFAAGVAMAQQGVSPEALEKMRQILSQKASFTAGQNKMSANLVLAAKAARNEPGVAGITDVIAPVPSDRQGLVTVDIRGSVTGSLMNQIQSAGGQVVSQSASAGQVQARIPLTQLDTVAGNTDVTSLRLPAPRHTNRAPWSMKSATRGRSLVSPVGISSFVGAVTSQGYIAHGANLAFAASYTGAGVKVGVLSDSATSGRVAALIASGDLPANTVILPGEGGDEIPGVEDEGAAIMEIVHDLAPNAQLYFATAFHSDVDFAANIIKLQQAGCRVIVDDVTYFKEGVFQDSAIARAVNQVTAAGTIYFSAAGNSGALSHGNSGTWEGDFARGSFVAGMGYFHNFGTAATEIDVNPLNASSPSGYYILQWSDPLGASSNDYDFFLLDSTGSKIIGSSTDPQTGTQDPVELIPVPGLSSAGNLLVVIQFQGEARALHIDTEGGVLYFATAGATFGHNAAASAVTLAATAWNSAHAGTRPFSGFANPTEIFSSDGPRKIFFQPDGTPITPGNFLFATRGGTTLQKPDLTAADGVFTKTPGFLPFFGTSAAAPHAAAIAALVLQARPDYTPAQVKKAMTATALDSMTAGIDRDSGYGIAIALPAVQYALSH